VRRPQQSVTHLRQYRLATGAEAGSHRAARSARMDLVQPRRQVRVSVDRRDNQHQNQADRRRVDG